jgi:hypothetical protein
MNSAIVLDADSTTLILNGRAITGFVAGDIMTLTPAADHSSQVIGSDGGITINRRADGDVYALMMRIQRYSDDDVFLNSAINQSLPVLFNGSLKQDFQRDGEDFKESWALNNGSLTTKPTVVQNDTDGNAVMEYTISFRSARRSI